MAPDDNLLYEQTFKKVKQERSLSSYFYIFYSARFSPAKDSEEVGWIPLTKTAFKSFT